MPRAGSGLSRPKSSAEMFRAGLLTAALIASIAGTAFGAEWRALHRRGRRHSQAAGGQAWRCGARPRHRRQPQRRPLPALPQRADCRGTLPGQPGAQPGGGGRALVGGPAAAPHRRRRASQSGHDHAALLRTTGLQRVAKPFEGKTILTARADRGCRGLSRDPEGVAMPGTKKGTTRRTFIAGAALVSMLPLASARATPEAMAAAIKEVVGDNAIREGPCHARPAALDRERQYRAPHRVGRKHDERGRLRQGDPRFQRKRTRSRMSSMPGSARGTARR